MPNLAGIYDVRADANAIGSTLAKMARVLDIPSVHYTVYRAIGRHSGCVNLLRGVAANLSQPVTDDQGGLWLMLDGELYNGDELRQRLRQQEQDCAALDDAALCLALYRAEGESFVGLLNGQFNIVLYRGDDHSLLVATDRYGYRPLFVAGSDTRLLFAVEMKAIVAALDRTPEVDGIGLLQIIREGIALGERTWLAPIHVLDPGTIVKATPKGIQRRRYHKVRYHEGARRMSAAAFVEEFGAKLRCATQRLVRRPDRIGISLSGGLDSRSVVLSIPPSRLPIPAYTFGYPESRDVLYARALAELLGLRHLQLALDPGYLHRVVTPAVWRTEGLLPFTSTTSIYFHNRIASAMDVILNGHCGDALTGSHLRPHMMLGCSRAQLIERMFRGRQLVADDDLRRVLNPTFYNRYAPSLFEAMQATFADIDNEEIPNVADAWDMENRQRRGTFHSPSIDRYRFEQRTPFLDNELVDHLLTAPPRWRFQQQAYKRMILSAFPQAAHIPWAYTGKPLTASPSLELARIGWNYGIKRVRSLLSRRKRNGSYLAEDFRDLGAEFRRDRRIAQVILDFAAHSSFPADVFDRRGISEVVERHWRAGQDLTNLVAALATVATAYRLFVFDPPVTMPSEADPSAASDGGDPLALDTACHAVDEVESSPGPRWP